MSTADWAIGELNTTKRVIVTVCNRQLTLLQDNGSGLVGTNVWDSAVLFCRYFERHGLPDMPIERLAGCRVIELGCVASGIRTVMYVLALLMFHL